ncbi:MAG: hypothetical protein WDN72_00045 [Alphaproteobacteria bacterium]
MSPGMEFVFVVELVRRLLEALQVGADAADRGGLLQRHAAEDAADDQGDDGEHDRQLDERKGGLAGRGAWPSF